MFNVASLRLAGWYLSILMLISLIFSGLVYRSSLNEVSARLDEYDARLDASGYHIKDYETFQGRQIEQARHNIMISLVMINATIAMVGGVASFFLAKRALKPIQEAHESQQRFVGDASHELRTPLAIMKTEIEVALQDSRIKKSELQQLLHSNLDEVNRLSEMSRMLLSLSKREYSSLEFRRIDIMDPVQVAIEATDQVPRIKVKPLKKLAYVMGNRSSLEELFSVLLDNALKHSPVGSSVVVQARPFPTAVAISISNEGVISKKDLPHVFKRFYRGEMEPSEVDGFGLGLSIAKQISELHGGTIQALSQPGKMTTFIITLPRCK